MSRSPRKGFTLVEMLVVIAVIGTLASLLLPAIQSARASARRSQCTQNIRQVGMANFQFATAKERFPGYQQVIGGKVAPWVIPLLPYIEQEAVYDQWADPTTGAPSPAPPVPPVAPTPQFEILQCPSDNFLTEKFDGGTSYVANCGFRPYHTIAFSAPPSAAEIAAIHAAQNKSNGVFLDRVNSPAVDSTVDISDIKDGLTNTIGISENLQAGQWWLVDPNPAGTNNPDVPIHNAGFVWLYVADAGAPPPEGTRPAPGAVSPEMKINGDKRTSLSAVINNFAYDRPSSQHRGGVMAVFLDGSTIFLNQNIAYHVYQALLTPNNRGSAVHAPSFIPQGGDYSF